MGNYTSRQLATAKRMLDEGKTVAEIRGHIAADNGRVETESTSVIGLPFEASDFYRGVDSGIAVASGSAERRALLGLG